MFKCPHCKHPLRLDAFPVATFSCPECATPFYEECGIVDFSLQGREHSEAVSQTIDCFGYQWNAVEFGHVEGSKKYSKELFLSRFGLQDEEELEGFCAGKTVYDPAVGSGRVEHLFARYAKEVYAGDLSSAVFAARKNLSAYDNVRYLRADLTNPPFSENSFDLVICHAILQHTKDAFEGLKALVEVVKEGGVIFFDVYRKAAPVRDFGDDYIRDIVSQMPEEEAWEALKPLTRMAESFSKQSVTIPEDFPMLGIEKGEQNLQRFMYYKLLKIFWNEDMSFDDNHTVIFDWFYPKIANRYTPEQVKAWLKALNLEIIRYIETEGGIGVIARKKSL